MPTIIDVYNYISMYSYILCNTNPLSCKADTDLMCLLKGMTL